MISIAIPTYRRPRYLAEALEGITREVNDAGAAVEVIVQDNASGDETKEVAESFSDLSVSYRSNESNLGPSENIVRACERCSGDYVFLLGDDDLIETGMLGRVIKGASSDNRPGVISGPVSHFLDGETSQTGRLSFRNARGEDYIIEPGGLAVEHMFARATMLSGLVLRRDLLDAEGARRHSNSLYPQIYLAGLAGREAGALYFAESIASVRDNPVVAWSYSRDYMAGGVFKILDDLTTGSTWARGVRKRVTKRRVRSTYSPLHAARKESFRAYLKTTRGLSSVSQYRKSPFFWAMVLGIGTLGIHGIGLLRSVLRLRLPNHVG